MVKFIHLFPGGGIATDEDSLGLPLNVIDFQSLKPQLSYLLNVYAVNFVSKFYFPLHSKYVWNSLVNIIYLCIFFVLFCYLLSVYGVSFVNFYRSLDKFSRQETVDIFIFFRL